MLVYKLKEIMGIERGQLVLAETGTTFSNVLIFITNPNNR
jgi:hypothetical protein